MPSSFIAQHPTNFTLRLAIADLRSAEDVRLDLDVTLALRVVDPARFDTQFAALDSNLTEARLAELLAETARTELAPLFRTLSLAELDANPKLRGWLGTKVDYALRAEADLAGRSGLQVMGVDAYDLRCQVWDEVRNAHETLYLRASLAQADVVGDKRLLDEMAAHVPVLEALLARKERLSELMEAENQVDQRLVAARRARQKSLHDILALMHPAPSQLRPELWSYKLGAEVLTAPLLGDGRVYVATRSGQVQAFDHDNGEPAWPQPVKLPAPPGDGLALAAGRLWVPGRNGVLYCLDAATGEAQPSIDIGGSLSSAPLVVGQRLLLSTDLRGLDTKPGYGRVVGVDPARGRIDRDWPVTTSAGLHAQPAQEGDRLYLGDRKGRVYALTPASGRVELLHTLRSMVLGAVLVDPQRGQLVVGEVFGFVTALTPSGRVLWQERLGGAVVGQPLLTEQGLFVGAGDGRLYLLDPSTGKARREPFVTGGPIATSPVAWGGLVFFGSKDGYLYAVDASSGELFWKYPSGSPVLLPPAVAFDGRLFVVDQAGRLSALRWCLSQYAEGARRLQALDPVSWDQVLELWLAAGEVEAALEFARHARRHDWVAELALGLNLYRDAAQSFEMLAVQHIRDASRASRCWVEAARAWLLDGQPAKAEHCRRKDAELRSAPLLQLAAADYPLLIAHEEGVVQVEVRNLTDFVAYDVTLRYKGHVKQAGEMRLGSLGAHQDKLVTIAVAPTASGSATLTVAATYFDSLRRQQLPVALEIRLKVNRPPEIHQHFHGPHIGGDGVIILHGGAGGERQVRLQGVNVPPVGAAYATLAVFESGLHLSGGADQPWYRPGVTAVLTASLSATTQSASVVAEVLLSNGSSSTVNLAPLGGGRFRGSYGVQNVPGYAEVRFHAQGTLAGGGSFERSHSALFQISPSTASLNGSYTDMPVPRWPGAAVYAALDVTAGVNVTAAGDYSLSGNLVDAAGNQVAHALATATLPAGTRAITFRFDGGDIYRSGRDGPYTLTDMLLVDNAGAALVIQQAQAVYVTRPYAARDFRVGDVFLPVVIRR